jgi:hypothetical protein
MAEQNTPLICRLDALTPAERARSNDLRRALVEATVEITETEDGFAYRYRAERTIYAQLAEWIALERRCCPFFDFRLEWPSGQEAPMLALGGGPDVKEFLRSAMQQTPPSARFE